jgi:hypothetical protein
LMPQTRRRKGNLAAFLLGAAVSSLPWFPTFPDADERHA